MENNLSEYIKVCEGYGWDVKEGGGTFVLSRRDPNGREYSFCATEDSFAEDAVKTCSEFDTDSYAYHSIMDYVLKNNGQIPHIRQELNAAESIKWHLKRLAFMLDRMANPGESVVLIMDAAKEAGFDVEYCPNCNRSDDDEDQDAVAFISGDIQAVAYCSSYADEEIRRDQLMEKISGSFLITDFFRESMEFYEEPDEQKEAVRTAAGKLKKMQQILRETYDFRDI